MKIKHIPAESTEFPNYYEIPGFSNFLISEDGQVICKKDSKKYRRGSVRKTTLDLNGYYRLNIKNDNGFNCIQSIHRLVCLAFYGEPLGDRNVVNHKDGNKLNNHYSNLEWVTYKENMLHALQSGLITKCKAIKVWDIISDKTEEYKSITDFSLGHVYPVHVHQSDIRIIQGRYIIIDENQTKDFYNREELLKSHKVILNVKTGIETIVASLREASDIVGVSEGAVFHALKHRRQFLKNFYLVKYFSDKTPWLTYEEYLEILDNCPRDIVHIDNASKKITIADSFYSLSKILNIPRRTLNNCCQRNGTLRDGSKVMYYDEFIKRK